MHMLKFVKFYPGRLAAPRFSSLSGRPDASQQKGFPPGLAPGFFLTEFCRTKGAKYGLTDSFAVTRGGSPISAPG